MITLPPSSRIAASSRMPPISTRCAGCASRSFIIGIRLCPPASSFPSSPNCWSIESASLTDEARWYSNDAGNIALTLLLRVADRAPDFFGFVRHVDMADAERLERIEHGADNAWRRTDGSRLADAFDAQHVHGRRSDGRGQLVVRQHVRLRYRIVHQRRGDE